MKPILRLSAQGVQRFECRRMCFKIGCSCRMCGRNAAISASTVIWCNGAQLRPQDGCAIIIPAEIFHLITQNSTHREDRRLQRSGRNVLPEGLPNAIRGRMQRCGQTGCCLQSQANMLARSSCIRMARRARPVGGPLIRHVSGKLS